MITIDAIRRAADVVGGHLTPTPLLAHPLLDAAVGGPVLVKHESVLPTGSFKVRGGVHLAAGLSDADRRTGLVTSSTGNHAQSVAFAARLAGTSATVVMPSIAPEVKRDAVRALGADVVIHGDSLGEAGAHARDLAAGTGARFVCPADPAIVLGHATLYLELLTARPDVAALYVPIGSGTGAAGACVVRDALAPSCRVVGVQSDAAPAAWRSWRAGELVSAPSRTRVSGLATTAGFALPQALMRGLDDFLLVSDDAITGAARLLAAHAHTLAEGAGAAALAGLLADPAPHPASHSSHAVRAVVLTGANASAEEIAALGTASAAA